MGGRERHEERPSKSVAGTMGQPFDLNVYLEEQARRTPWWVISMAVHLLVVGLLSLWVLESRSEVLEEAIAVALPPPPPEKVEIEALRDLFEDEKIVKSDVAVEEPVFKDAKESDHAESPDDKEFAEMEGESLDFLSNKPLRGEAVYDTIGLSGGVGGPFGDRGGRRDLVPRGSPPEIDPVVRFGLEWLARHQGSDGGWGASNYTSLCGGDKKCDGVGAAEFDVGVTGLALLAFLGRGHTHLSREKYKDEVTGKTIYFGDVVKNSIKWLIKNQDAEGCFGGQSGGKYMYNHAIAALAMAEAYGLTGSQLFRDPAQRGIDFVLAAQNPSKAWRYSKKSGDNDTSVTGWCVMALKSAEISGLNVGRVGFDGAKAWVEEATDETYYKVGYTAKGTGQVLVEGKNREWKDHPALTAAGMLSRVFIDKNQADPALEGGAKLLVQDLPVWDMASKTVDFYYWYYGSLALFQYDGPGGKYWRSWNEKMKDVLVDNQRKKQDGCLDGSWDTVDVDRWGWEGGRVYGTAINTLTLEVYYRYGHVFGGERGK